MAILQSGITKSLAVAYDIDNSLRFNIADSAVTVGVILYLLHSLFMNKPELIERNG